MRQPKNSEKPPDDAPISTSSGDASVSPEATAEAPKTADDSKKFEEFFILAPGKTLQCAAGLVRGGDEVTGPMLGQARFDRLLEAGTVVAKKRRVR